MFNIENIKCYAIKATSIDPNNLSTTIDSSINLNDWNAKIFKTMIKNDLLKESVAFDTQFEFMDE